MSIENPYKLNNVGNSSNIHTQLVKLFYSCIYIDNDFFVALGTLYDDDLTDILDALLWMGIQNLIKLVENDLICRISSYNCIRYFISIPEIIYVILLQIHFYMSKLQLRGSKNKVFENCDAKFTVL